jgi:hypothetical protein
METVGTIGLTRAQVGKPCLICVLSSFISQTQIHKPRRKALYGRGYLCIAAKRIRDPHGIGRASAGIPTSYLQVTVHTLIISSPVCFKPGHTYLTSKFSLLSVNFFQKILSLSSRQLEVSTQFSGECRNGL